MDRTGARDQIRKVQSFLEEAVGTVLPKLLMLQMSLRLRMGG